MPTKSKTQIRPDVQIGPKEIFRFIAEWIKQEDWLTLVLCEENAQEHEHEQPLFRTRYSCKHDAKLKFEPNGTLHPLLPQIYAFLLFNFKYFKTIVPRLTLQRVLREMEREFPQSVVAFHSGHLIPPGAYMFVRCHCIQCLSPCFYIEKYEIIQCDHWKNKVALAQCTNGMALKDPFECTCTG